MFLPDPIDPNLPFVPATAEGGGKFPDPNLWLLLIFVLILLLSARCDDTRGTADRGEPGNFSGNAPNPPGRDFGPVSFPVSMATTIAERR